MGWFADYRRDISKYTGPEGGWGWKQVLTEQGLWALLQYRIESAVYHSKLPWIIKKPVRLGLIVSHKIVEILTNISLPCGARIGPGLHLPHCGARVVHSGAIVGVDCCISQGVTIGVSGRGDRRGVPLVGDRVYFGVNAVAAGKIVIGNDVAISANSLVTRDVPDGSTVMGVPAVVVSSHGSAGYIVPTLQSRRRLARRAKTPRPVKQLLILARVNHYLHEGHIYSYTPYVRELDVWAELFSEVVVAGTLRHEPPPRDCTAFSRSNIRVEAIAEAGGDRISDKIWQLFAMPRILWQITRCALRADAIHARCPCDLGFLGVLLGPIFSDRLIAKYATQWLHYDGEPWSWRLQRALLRSWWWRGPVTVYGKWPNQPEKVIPFFTSMLTEAQLDRARAAAARPHNNDSFRVLFVGRLSSAKNVDVLCSALSELKVSKLECAIVGEGPERSELEARVAALGLKDSVRFTGGLDFEGVLNWYEWANVLVLVSDVEGWPKAVAEGMAFGLVCVGTERGMMPMMLGEGRGLLVPPRDAAALTAALQQLADRPEQMAAMSARAAEWAQRFSLEGLRDALRELMSKHWQNFNPRLQSHADHGISYDSHPCQTAPVQ